MKPSLRILLFFILCWGFCTPFAHADHVLGADLTWSCDPQNSCLYTFTYSFYVDCTPSNTAAPSLQLSCLTSPLPQTMVGTAWDPPGGMGIGTDITPLCPGLACDGSSLPGVREFVYTQVMDLCTSPICPSWEVNWFRCCRSNNITSLVGTTNVGATATSQLSFDPGNCNSSPTFLADPIVFVCAGQSTTIAMGAVDPDGDQLSYSLTDCMDSQFNPLSYAAGFSPTSPLGPNWNVSLDANTGVLNLSSASSPVMSAVVCVRVNEIRNGLVIGSVVRDIQIRVINCTDNLPTLTGFDGNSDFTSKTCASASTCFNILSNDPDPSDNVSIALLAGPPGMTLATAGTPHPTATVCWTPTANDVGTHTFVLEVRDDACPRVGIQQYTYTLVVDDCPPCDLVNTNVNWTHTQSLLDITVTNTTTGGPVDFTEYSWGDGSANVTYPGNHTSPVNHTFPAAGTYEVCVKTYTYIGDACCHDSLCKMITVTDNPCDEHSANWYSLAVINDPCTYYFWDASTPGSSSVLWDFGTGGPLVSGSGIPYTFPGSGTYTITMYSTYHPPSKPELCCYDSFTATLEVDCKSGPGYYSRMENSGSSIAWNQLGATLRVKPDGNPADLPSKISIYDLGGKLLFEQANVSVDGATFDLSGVAAGIYLVRVLTGDRVETHKFARP